MSAVEAPTPGPPAGPEDVVEHEVVPSGRTVADRLRASVVLALLGLATAIVFAVLYTGGGRARLNLSGDGGVHVPDLVFPERGFALVVGVVLVGVAVVHLVVGLPRRWVVTVGALGAAAFLLALLGWDSAKGGGVFDLIGLLGGTIALSVPLVLGAMAGILCERSGVINVAIEGQMTAGAWAGALFGTLLGGVFGLLGAAVFGALMGLLLAVFAIRYLVNQVVLGVVLNVFAAGLTGYFFDAFMQPPHAKALNQPHVFASIDIPLLHDIPVLGPLLFEANIVVYLMYVVVIAVEVALFHTRWGLRTRAVGEHPRAADTVGIRVRATRYRNVMLGGAVAGLGGAYFTIGSVGGFGKNITAGNGFIALAAVIFGRWSPRGAVGAALLFGFASALQTRLSNDLPAAIPSSLFGTLPYVATILAVAGLVGKVRAPAADGEPYV